MRNTTQLDLPMRLILCLSTLSFKVILTVVILWQFWSRIPVLPIGFSSSSFWSVCQLLTLIKFLGPFLFNSCPYFVTILVCWQGLESPCYQLKLLSGWSHVRVDWILPPAQRYTHVLTLRMYKCGLESIFFLFLKIIIKILFFESRFY